MYILRMEFIRGFLVYVYRTYRSMTPYLKGVHLNMDSWRPYGDEEGWRTRGQELKIPEVEGNCEEIEEADKIILVMGVLHLNFDLLAIGRLTEGRTPPWRQLWLQIQSVAYLMGEASGLGSGSVLLGQGKLVSESGEFTPLYQGISSKI